MSARTQEGSIEAFRVPLQQAVSCVTREVLVRSPIVPGQPRALRFRDEAVPLRGRHRLELTAELSTSLTNTPDLPVS